eukprot:CAMPEP_0198340502 /NCGR_PEP_ID=MMETSP1450-20131203/44725_1 /TAXON_ID=753684 ORGANISM="Madagascaria erythrocladiodes, Strain CCMP3234" /NCGR_SAMPLE_ID=MMETSP1450 /ASSEMBLY_ACC=CAM_ASM_001115 /LENGTH=34 /DNA_ID= /DNA_START= /DNA_END= /DNA_ORIENTATION=
MVPRVLPHTSVHSARYAATSLRGKSQPRARWGGA